MNAIINLILKIKPVLVIVFVPILMTLLFGVAFSTIFLEDVPIAVYDMDQSQESRAITDDFSECATFKIVKNMTSDEELEEDIMMGDIKGGLVIPEGFGKDLRGTKGAEALMLMDATNFLVGNNLMQSASQIFMEKNAELQAMELASGNMVPYMAEKSLSTLSVADRTLYNPQASYYYYIYAGLLGIFIQQTYLNIITARMIEEKNRLKLLPCDRESRKIQKANIAKQVLSYGGLTFITSLSCLILSNWLFGYPLNGGLFPTLLIQLVFLACLTGVAFIFATFFDNETHCVQVIMFLAIPTMMTSGYGWPEYIMAPGFAPVLKVLWPLYYYINPLKDLMLKGADLWMIKDYILGGIIFAAFWVPVGILVYRIKIKTMRQIENLDK